MTISAAHRPASSERTPARSVDAAFRSARRHSGRVRALKLALPALALLMVVGFFGKSWLASTAGIALNLVGSAVEGGRLVMADPRLDGYTSGDRAYTVTASRAIQDIGDTSRIDLEGIDARLPFDRDNWVTVMADRGAFHREANRLDLDSGVTIVTDTGLRARLKNASVDIKDGSLVTDDPVDVEGEGTRIEADSLKVTGNGSVLVFDRRVRVEIDAMRRHAAPTAQGGTQ